MEKSSVEIITVIPHNQFHFRYIINEGGIHTIQKEKCIKYFSSFVSLKNKKIIQEYLSSFVPFLIIPSDDKVLLLSKELQSSDSLRGEVKKEMEQMHKQLKNGVTLEKNESNFKKVIDKFIKIPNIPLE